MTYLRANNRSKEKRNRIGIAVGTITIVLVAIQIALPHFFPALFTTIARPFWRAEFSVASDSLRSPSALLVENEDLKRQLADADVRLKTVQDTEDQNIELKALLGRGSTTMRVLVAVLVRPPASGYDELIIDA